MPTLSATAARLLLNRGAIPLILVVLATHLSPASAQTGGVYYRYCADARAAGVAPIRRGQPGYGRHLDRDGDGIACELYIGNARRVIKPVRPKRSR